MFQFHLATHDNKKALLSIRVNDKEIASVFDQNHKDNHKNSMAGTNVVHNVKRGDQVSIIINDPVILSNTTITIGHPVCIYWHLAG